jgi:hypothetical protein
MNNPSAMPSYSPEFVRPLHEAKNEFLQVLVPNFSIKAKGGGFEFDVAFDGESQAVWRREAKDYLRRKMSAKKRSALQTKIKQFFAGKTKQFVHDDPFFPFRLGNGGTLPVVRLEAKDYYCLFFRDSHPVGWNIANGGANHVFDLLHPDAIIERELREELIVVDPEQGRRYVFDWHDARLRDHPDFALANQLWMDRFRQEGIEQFTESPLPLKWLPAPDAGLPAGSERFHDSMRVQYANWRPIRTGHGLLNINAEDFGIEFDRVAKLSVGPDAVFCDGEVVDGRLLNRIVGLFEVERLNRELKGGAARFLPDRLFWNGLDRTGKDVVKVVGEYLDSLAYEFPKAKPPGWDLRKPPLGLCPVTRNVIHRYLQLARTVPPPPPVKYDVFLSFGSEDLPLARQVYDRLMRTEDCQVFMSDITMNHGLFGEQIDAALDAAWAFVAVGSHRDHLYKSWVKYEWQQFHNDMMANQRGKSEKSPFLAVVRDMNIQELPRPFLTRNNLEWNQDPSLAKLDRFLRKT